MILRVNIVALSHCDVKDHLIEYAQNSVGKRLQLVPEPTNPFDPFAVKAKQLLKTIGYVSTKDTGKFWTISQAIGRAYLEVRVVDFHCNEDGKSGYYLIAEGNFDANPEGISKDMFVDKQIASWTYTGPILSIDMLSRITECTVILQSMLSEIHSLEDEAGKKELMSELPELLDYFVLHHHEDYSYDMQCSRLHIEEALAGMDDEYCRKQYEALLEATDYLTCSSGREEVAHYLFIDLPIRLGEKSTGTYDYGDRLDEIEQELETFPYDMYRKFKADPVDLLREIYYKRVPRRQMLQLVSGIILMIMHHRVSDVKRWGKRNDEVALQEMKELRHIKMGAEEQVDNERTRREIAELCIRKMAYLYNARTYKHFIHSQADWYPVLRVLSDIGIFEKDDHKGFAEYLAQVFGESSDKSSEGEGSAEKASIAAEALPFELTSEMEFRLHVPVCKKKDLDQAAERIFEKTKARSWDGLSDEDIAGIQRAKYNRYCDIVGSFCRLLREEENQRGVNLVPWE